jgi:hypothetical protein
MIVSILLKQAAKWMPDVHPQLRAAFEKEDVPTIDVLLKIFEEYNIEISRKSSMFVMFDALDECNKEHFGRIVKLIQNFNASGIRVYVTARQHRDHWMCQEFQIQPLIIEADINDVKNYLMQELEERKPPDVNCEFMEEIVDEITREIDGM